MKNIVAPLRRLNSKLNSKFSRLSSPKDSEKPAQPQTTTTTTTNNNNNNMSIQTELNAVSEQFSQAPAEIRDPIGAAAGDFAASFNRGSAVQPGQKLPAFTLPNALGKDVSSTELLSKGPILITFYRGGWCPYCNVVLHHLQANLKEFEAKNVTLVAISPETPDTSLTTAEKAGLAFPVLSDKGNKFADQLGLVFKQPESVRPAFEKMGLDFAQRKGENTLDIPVPATLLVDQTGTVRNTFVEPDFTTRLDPKDALKWVNAL
ncbi:AhpC-TSA-domain-containing protein [Xylona heveae TC161]|uniref:thioredoxin-dependent peroxiredoxin n=1 Tax=Xylona heveae (strain CBS 132557 / TC161) TaxID=1328760 RepID=A0A164ZJG5_XYLHT|nr:AhpC-TSA-domain-containing protein [Xylona heveae TC161]KZF19175.1 AhpC-TSA-domain-containing protein [Xylona heveae TC161]